MTQRAAGADPLRLMVADPHERAGLGAYLGRLAALDDRGSARLQASGTVLGVWGGPPLDVVTLRPVELSEPVLTPLDRTVAVQRLAQRLSEAGPDGSVELPDVVPGPAWAGLLPPRSGWAELATVPASAVRDAVRLGVDGFHRRVELLAEGERTQPALQAVANQIWSRPFVAGVPLRAAHAAELTGLLPVDGEVGVYESGAWLRLACPGGSVALRRDGGVGLGLDLNVWSLLSPPRPG